MKKIYLTIDDAPSKHLKSKIDFLSEHHIPAVFYCRGEYIDRHQDHLIYAIQKGYVLGNHGFSHPYFSKLSFADCCQEIQNTETLIDNCYQKSGIPRPFKLMRFPFADRGAGGNAALPKTSKEQEKTSNLQSFLKQEGFIPLTFDHKKNDSFIDAYWDWDTQDYKEKHYKSPELYLKKLQEDWDNHAQETIILLLHDFDYNHSLFEATMTFLLEKNVRFLDLKP